MFAERILILHTEQLLAWMTVTPVPEIKMILQNHRTPLLSGMYKLSPLKLALNFLPEHLVTLRKKDRTLAWMAVTLVPEIKMIPQNHRSLLLSGNKLSPLNWLSIVCEDFL